MGKKRRRYFKGRITPPPAPVIREWQVVMAELKAGTASVGVRFNHEPTVHFFSLHQTPQDAVKIVARIARGEITLKDIAGMDWQAVEMPETNTEGK